MGCCIAAALMIALVRRAWYRLFPHRRPPESGFAPAAFRAAPGAAYVPATDGPRASAAPAGSRASAFLGAVSVTCVLYAAAAAAAASVAAHHHHGGWPHRGPAIAAVAVLALLAAAALHRGPLPGRTGPGVTLTGAGLTWSVLGLLDMRGGAMCHGPSALAAGLALHGVGVLALLAGAATLLRPDPRPRSTTRSAVLPSPATR